ncbi:pleckstrin homology domain-containing family G member 2 [Sceloporus undulatus]|uniref:pleckstrin homology domain-containing family G member 2 n=1 Tax=Sceloporus undulatus TaxID=8520 RepID=UPI001C4CA64C|nr:pleckstrin homology domain-containing family G member 2 [Sceloporus undulatus]XP_042294804.1 pleckstrin homology domain-containing family G member 2 [Sceloporus undulatus]XP_042294806.1 pleckstrin homology domain-containing family G member 2 [Sceloporus undulatus]XP_042294807.1 pleckstrin homology domain-containing family G member 2 [Sceloporus undulatus]
MPEGARRGSTKKAGKAAAPRPSSVSSLGGISSSMASDPILGSCTSVNTVCSDSDRPISLSSSASSASLQDSHSAFGSSGGLGGCPPSYPHQNGSDISLDLTPVAFLDGPGGDVPAYPKEHSGWLSCPGRAKERRMKLSHLDRVVMEIVETEQAYVRDLRSIVEDYLGCIIDCGQLPLKPEQVNALFCNIEDIYEFNSELLEDMERNPSPHAVAECFVQRSEEFDIYTLYCMNYPNSVSVLRECMENEALAKFFRERQASLSHSLPLETYLLKPVQRILKYHLLLQELAKHYDKSSPGYEAVEEASITMTAVAWYINDMKRKQEHATRLQEIEGLLVGWNGPELGAFGELILEGQFRVPRARKERVFFLLSKVILIAKRRGDAFIYKSHIFCCNLALQENTKDPMSFKISDLSIPKQQHVVQVRNQEEKRLWIHYLKRLIVENHPASIPQKAKQVLLENSFQSSPEVSFSTESPKKPLPSPRLDECKASARNRRQSEPPEYMYSPERARRSCPVIALEKSGSYWRGRRQSEPAKDSQVLFHQAEVAKLKHADSDGELFPDTETLHPSGSCSSTLPSSIGETGGEESDRDKGEMEFSLAEESIPTNLSITEEILELLSQRGLDKDAGREGTFLDERSLEASRLAPQDHGEGQEKGEEEEVKAEHQFLEDPSLDAIHVPSPTSSPHEHPPLMLRHPFNSDSSEEEDQPRHEGSDGPSPLHVLEDLGMEEAHCGKPVEIINEDANVGQEMARDGLTLSPKDTDKSHQPAPCLRSSLVGPNREEKKVKKMEEGFKRDSTLTKEDWLLIEKIKNYYEGVEAMVGKAAEVGKKDYAPPPVPPGVVRESILRFNSILRQNDPPDWEMGGAKFRKPRPQSAAAAATHEDSNRSRSQSCDTQCASGHEDCKEGRSQLSVNAERTKGGRSCSEGGQSPGRDEHSGQSEVQSSRPCCANSEKEQNLCSDTPSSATPKDSGRGRSCPEYRSECSLEEDPEESEFRSCAEIRRAWQEKERKTMEKGVEAGSRRSYASPEKTPYVEPLRIVEDSDLEELPPVPSKDPEGATHSVGAKGKWVVEIPTDESPRYLPSLDIYENNGGDPCLLENSERIISKVQALAKMYSEKINRMKVQKRGPGMRPRVPHRKTPNRTLVGVQEGRPGASVPHCEPRIYGHVLIHEPIQHVIRVQENTPLLAATRGTALELRSERPAPLLSPDLLGPLRQALLCPPSIPQESAAPQERDLLESSMAPECNVDALIPTVHHKERESPLPPKSITEVQQSHTNGEETAKVPRDVEEVAWSSSETQLEASTETGMPCFSLESQSTLKDPGNTDISMVCGATEAPKPRLPSSTVAEGTLPQREERPPSHQSDVSQAESFLKRTTPSPSLELGESNHVDAEAPVLSKDPSETLPGLHCSVTQNSVPVPENSKPLQLTSSGIAEATLSDIPCMPSPPRMGASLQDSLPAPTSGSDSPTSIQEQSPMAPLPKLFPTSPVRRCLSSSAAAISRYIAASCISQSLAKKNGAPQPEELQASSFRPLTPPRVPANPLALLPKAAPRGYGVQGKPEALFPRDTSQGSSASLCFGSGLYSPTRHRAFSSATQAFDRHAPFSSSSEPNSRVQSPLPMKPRICSPPPARPRGCTFTPLCAHPHGQQPAHMASPVALAPNPAIRALPQFSHSRPRGNSLPNSGLTESLASNGGHMPLGCIPGPQRNDSGSSPGGQSQELGGIKWPNVPGLCLKYVNRERSYQMEEVERCPKPDFPITVDVARAPEKNQQKVSYSTTVNIQIGGSGRIASFSNAQVSLTHPLLATSEQLSLRKVNGSAWEAPSKT